MSRPIPAVLLLGDFTRAGSLRHLQAVAARGFATLVVDMPAGCGQPARWPGGAEPTEPTETAGIAGIRVIEIVDRAVAWSRRYGIRGALALHDEYVDAAALVADLLALPTPGLRAAQVCRSDRLRRRYLATWSPRWELLPPGRGARAAAGWTAFPAVVGPVGSAGRPVQDMAELRAAADAFGRNTPLVVEERPLGSEHSVESLSIDSEVRHLEMTAHREAAEGPPAPPRPPQLAADDRRRLAETHRAVLQRLEFDSGVAHATYRQVPGRTPVLLGIAAVPAPESAMTHLWPAGEDPH